MEGVGGIIILAVVVAAFFTLLAFVGAVILAYWPIVLALLALTIAGVVYLKRQKRARNMV